MNRVQLVEQISEDTGIPKIAAVAVVKSLIQTISRTLKKEGKIGLSGLGTFTKVKRKARKAGIREQARLLRLKPQALYDSRAARP